jgi:hypothetical protein
MERDDTHAAFKKCNNKAIINYSYAIQNLWFDTAVTLQTHIQEVLGSNLG